MLEIHGRIEETRTYYLGRSSREPEEPLSEVFERMTGKGRSADRQPDAQPTNRRICSKSYKPETDNTRKSKFSRNKTSTYPARKGGLSPVGFSTGIVARRFTFSTNMRRALCS